MRFSLKFITKIYISRCQSPTYFVEMSSGWRFTRFIVIADLDSPMFEGCNVRFRDRLFRHFSFENIMTNELMMPISISKHMREMSVIIVTPTAQVIAALQAADLNKYLQSATKVTVTYSYDMNRICIAY